MTLVEALQRYKYQLLSVIALLATVYFTVIQQMAVQWYQDENYSHGFLVPLIAGYFLYERRETLKNTPVSPWNPGLVLVVLGLLQLLAGSLATEYFTMRSSLVVLLAGLVHYFFGRAVFRQVLLPLGYLLLMVPLPYIVYDLLAFPLKLFVTRVSVAFLQLVGIVVLREGNIIMFPTLTLEVADACSGMRSLMSLLALGIAFAFFLRISPLRRCLLIASAIPVAILTNAFRVIVTGILAHFWGAQSAEGFFHEFAGLLVFALAMIILGGIGALLKEEEAEPLAPAIRTATPDTPPQTGHWRQRFILVWILLVLAGSYKTFHTDLLMPLHQPFSSFPAVVREWQLLSQDTFSSEILQTLKPTDYLSRTYADARGTKVQLYIGYHGGGKGAGEIHSPRHCLPGSGWQQKASAQVGINTPAGRVNLVRAVYTLGERTEIFYYWFQVRERTLDDEYSLKLAEITGSLLQRRRDASFIRIAVPAGNGSEHSADAGERFIRDFYPEIRSFLPR